MEEVPAAAAVPRHPTSGNFGGLSGAVVTSGFFKDAGHNAKTYVTPQPMNRKYALTGIPMSETGHGGATTLIEFPNNYIVYGENGILTSTGNGGHDPTSDDGHLNDGKAVLQYKGGAFELVPSESYDGGTHGGLQMTHGAIKFFNTDASSSVSGSFFEASASAKIVFDTGSSAIKLLAGDTDATLVEVLHVSRSGVNPRIGIGVSSPLKAFDFKSISDDDRGGELLIRGSRTALGAIANDEVGRINFTIDSGSFAQVDVSGSAAEIVAIADEVDQAGVKGSLSLRVASTKTAAPIQRIKISGYNGDVNYPYIEFTGSAAMDSNLTIGGDFAIAGKIDSYITASSGISASGEIIANELTLDDDINLKVDSTINFASNTTVNAGQITYAESTDELMLAATYTNLTLNKNTGLIFNELAHLASGALARDFRVEGYGDTHLFFISGSANKIGIGTSTPVEKLTVVGNISASGTITGNSFVGNMDGGLF
mgnify:FL=1